jgi:hypothetical protein
MIRKSLIAPCERSTWSTARSSATLHAGADVHIDDVLRFVLRALRGYPVRTALMLLAMAIGVAAVVILTSLGSFCRAARRQPAVPRRCSGRPRVT